VAFLECHATGTGVGDATEIRSSATVFSSVRNLPIASLKSNLGHLITAAGAAGIIKLIECMRAATRSPSLHAENLTVALQDSPFRVLQQAEPWPLVGDQRVRIAAISAFGFGGNNAHLILSEDDPELSDATQPVRSLGETVAVVGIGAIAGKAANRAQLSDALFSNSSLRDPDGKGAIVALALELTGLRFPPRDLTQTLPQQLAILHATREALFELDAAPGTNTTVFIAMEPDAEVARFGTRWRLDTENVAAQNTVIAPLEAAGVIGCMPNIPANRISAQFDFTGPSFTLQSGAEFAAAAGADAGLHALHIAARALRRFETDAAVVGAVDFCCEPVTIAAGNTDPADAAVALVLKRLPDAIRDGNRIYALLEELPPTESHKPNDDLGDVSTFTRTHLGNSGAANGLLQVTLACLSLHHRRRANSAPWLSAQIRRMEFSVAGAHGLRLSEAIAHARRAEVAGPKLYFYSGADKAAVLAALIAGQMSSEDITANSGSARLVLVATSDEFDQVRARAILHLQTGAPAGSAVHFCAEPVLGDIAFAFAGAGAGYPGMGLDLVRQMPQLLDALKLRSQRLLTALDWAYATPQTQPTALQQLWGASALSQLHLELSQGVLGLQADAWLGYSSGETNALVAAGVWRDADALMAEMAESGLVTHLLGGEFGAVQALWQRPVKWASWTVLAPIDQVRAALAGLERVHLAIINSDADCLIAGEESGCSELVRRIGESRCLRLIYPLAVHVPELDAVAPEWLALHHRQCHPPRSGKIYSTAFARSYTPEPEACAAAILAQANQTLDLRPLVLRAWNDGVRIFIEHGPGGSFGRAIRTILGERNALVVSLDRKVKPGEDGFAATLSAIAALLAAGVPMHYAKLAHLLAPVAQLPDPQRRLLIPGHWPRLNLSPIAKPKILTSNAQLMQPAPRLPPVLSSSVWDCEASASPSSAVFSDAGVAPPYAVTDTPTSSAPNSAVTAQLAYLASAHQQYLTLQGETHAHFLRLRLQAQELLFALANAPVESILAEVKESVRHVPVEGQSSKLPNEATSHHEVSGLMLRQAQHERVFPGLEVSDESLSAVLKEAVRPEPVEGQSRKIANEVLQHHEVCGNMLPLFDKLRTQHERVSSADSTPIGPSFSREQLLTHSDGQISEIFGAEFKAQDQYLRQVRMPKPPMLLADRVLGIAGVPAQMGLGRIWTETDVGSQDWYLHQNHMPAGVMIEAGQADLMLISYLGVDAHNRGERVYRLLGCELTYHGDLPRVGDTLRFDIALDGHAAQGDVRLMFFHYDCVNTDARGTVRPQLSVRQGQAGFFTDAELAESAGCLWAPETQTLVAQPSLDPPLVECQLQALDQSRVRAFAAGDTAGCFGAGFEWAQTHTRSPSIANGTVNAAKNSTLLLDRVSDLALHGGPWQRGYLRAELDIYPEQWFFAGHFKNDPCMPGTLMFDACLAAMAIYLTACGYTIKRDGWRFQPVPELKYQLQCRGQVTPNSKLLVTEVFVEERIAGPIPTVYADLLCTVDGLKAFHARRVALQLVPDWPMQTLTAPPKQRADEFVFDEQSLLACALGRPSAAFGPMYQRFDGPTRVARLPSPPYHFISRIAEVHGPIGVMQAGARVMAEYDLPDSVWYLDENGCRRMPFAVLLEAALQPCGWLSSYVGSALSVDAEVGFRNLDGEGIVSVELIGGGGTLCTEVELLAVSATAGMIIETFAVRCTLAGREVYRLKTVFGFFPPAALAAQAGLPITAQQREFFARPSNSLIDLSLNPADFFAHPSLRLAGPMLRMLDRIEGVWPSGGAAGLGQLRAVKDVDINEWFFKAHFFQDPVQPGSLGLEAMLQALQCWAILQNLGSGVAAPRFETIALGQKHSWKYRGQVLPQHKLVHTTLEITEQGVDARGVYLCASASLWADGQRIYEATGLALRIVSGAAPP
jgi:acyl transferase domain-containing protein/3-hydroxymyristoyl/3-hydroxydecanoyl-(acyl carrier protein) dehydratase